MQTPKMLTIAQAAKEFNLPKNFVRQAVLDGRIVHVKAGKKHLINVQKMQEWLNVGDSPMQSTLSHMQAPQTQQAQNQMQSSAEGVT